MDKKLGLRTDRSSLTAKKYLGDPDDRHFIPDSPLVDRQVLTEQEEGELKRACALVLANVQHSDDTSDDPLKYIAAHIQDGRGTHQTGAKRDRTSQPAQCPYMTSTKVSQQLTDLKPDTATPSEASRRHTSTTTDDSTPLTSAGLTPGDAGSRFSDAARRSVNSTRKPGSGLRNEASTSSKSRTTSNAGLHRSLETCEPTVDAEVIGRTVRLVKDSSSRLESSSNRSMDINRPARLAGPDLNKSLPPPPPLADWPILNEPKPPHIGRLMNTIRKKKSIIAESRDTSTASAPSVPSAEETRAATTLQPRIRTATAPVFNGGAQPLPPPKKKFHLRFFPRLHRPTDVLVS
ncbi:hypothetical protein A1O3_03366 [Capronia epimyces CBS 606.96]|uniref:Uncharacterized protein n=1 Tax=Capronia epimyces CBS 606.96 TaxID=1182542 RepID=W9Y9W3_9EURO|nr:uncharacterized protein A1O3_03366 [Capronia epimyces CBS 606.96]EXJ86415.1 hypothetical protein A1O3_03366 [Capronia epimyces CBS 606.96]